MSALLKILIPIVCILGCNLEKSDLEDDKSEPSTDEAEADMEDIAEADRSHDDAIIITYGAGYAPFAWGEGSSVRGVQVDFVEEILAKRMGLNVIHVGCPWKRCQKWVREGKRDGFFTVPTPERAEYTQKSSLPFYETHFVMHVKKGHPLADTLPQLRSLKDFESPSMQHIRHIHMHGSGWHENALRNAKNVTTVRDASVIPLMLALDRADLYIEQAEMFRYQAKEVGISHAVVTIEKPSIRKVGWHLFIGHHSKHRDILPEVDKTLKTLQASGELDQIKMEIFRKYGI